MATNSLPLTAQDAIDDGYLLETFLSATPDHVYFKDTESRLTRVSASFARWVGLADANDAVGLTDADLFAPAHASAARADELKVMSTGQPIVAFEECESWPDGRETWVSSTKVPDLPKPLTFSLGIAVLQPDEPQTLEDLMAEADRAMYAEKRGD